MLSGYITILSLGFFSIPAFLFYGTLNSTVQTQQFIVHLTPKPFDLIFRLLAILIISIVSGLIITRLLNTVRFGRIFRNLLYGNLILGLILGLSFFIQGPLNSPDLGPYSLQSTCEMPISKTVQIRKENYNSTKPEHRGLAGIPLFYGTSYYISRDDGLSWSQFMHVAYWYGTCKNNVAINEKSFGFWEGGTLFVTHDSGENWHIWYVNQLMGDFAVFVGKFADTNIDSVTFTDEIHGQMQLADPNNASQEDSEFILDSTDGGLTWHLTD